MAGVQSASFLSLLKSGKYSDMVLACGEKEFKVHRAVVCPDSTFLDMACGGHFKESSERRVTLDEEDPEILARVILYLYTGDYETNKVPDFFDGPCTKRDPATPDQTPKSASKQAVKHFSTSTGTGTSASSTGSPSADRSGPLKSLHINALVYKYADMLGIERLRTVAAKRFLADARTMFHFDDFHRPLDTMYRSTRVDDKELRHKVTTMCVRNYKQTERNEATVQVLREHEGNLWDVAVPILKDIAGLQK